MLFIERVFTQHCFRSWYFFWRVNRIMSHCNVNFYYTSLNLLQILFYMMSFTCRWISSHKSLSLLDGFYLRLRLGEWEEGLGGTGYYVASINGMYRCSFYYWNISGLNNGSPWNTSLVSFPLFVFLAASLHKQIHINRIHSRIPEHLSLLV